MTICEAERLCKSISKCAAALDKQNATMDGKIETLVESSKSEKVGEETKLNKQSAAVEGKSETAVGSSKSENVGDEYKLNKQNAATEDKSETLGQSFNSAKVKDKAIAILRPDASCLA